MEKNKADYRKKIIELIEQIDDFWLLDQIYRLILNITK